MWDRRLKPEQNPKEEEVKNQDLKEEEVKPNKKKKKKSTYHVVPSKDLEFYGKMLMLKQISYKSLFEKLKKEYSEIHAKGFESLRYFMITNKYVINENSFDKINKNIEKSKLVQRKKEKIIEGLYKDLTKDDRLIEYLFNNKVFINKIKNLIQDELGGQ